MKNLKLFLEEEEEESLQIGLARLVKPLPDHEVFFQINQYSGLHFERLDDFEISGKYYQYFHTVYKTYHRDSKTCIHFISNKSSSSVNKKEINQLFTDEEEMNYLLSECKDVDYLITTPDNIPEFSVFLLPENMMFQIQNFELSSDEELFHLIQYYE